MERLDVPIKVKDPKKPIYFHLITDVHRASLTCDWRQLKRDVAAIAQGVKRGEQHYTLLGGDLCNSISTRDKRHDSASIAPSFREHEGIDLFNEEVRAVCADFRPIRDTIIGSGTGNHEDSIAKYNAFHPAIAIAEQLDVPFLGYSALIRLRIKAHRTTNSILVFWHHGFGAARSAGGKLTMLHKLRESFDRADIYLTGHVHRPVQEPEISLGATRRGKLRITADMIWLINGGTYQKTYDTNKEPQKPGQFNPNPVVRYDYAEVKAYKASVIGHAGFSVTHKGTDNGWEPQIKGEWWLA